MLESWGALSPNQDGLDWGDVAGFGADLVVDPLNLLGAGMVKRGLGLADDVARSNKVREAMLAKGAMPEEVARLTKVVDDSGMPVRNFHGTPWSWDGRFDISKNAPSDGLLAGPGAYFTNDPGIASEYALKNIIGYSGKHHGPNVKSAYLDARNPFPFEGISTADKKRAIAESWLRNVEKSYPYGMEWLRSNADQHMDKFGEVLPLSLDELQPWLEGATNERMWNGLQRLGKAVRGEHDASMREMLLKSPLRYYARGNSVSPTPSATLLNKSLQDAGYDAISYPGGMATMGRPHDAINIFDPSQIYYPAVAPAERVAPSINPILAALAAINATQAGTGY